MGNTVPRPRLRAHADSITAVPVEDEPVFYPRHASRHKVRWGLITTGMLAILLPLLLCQFVIAPWVSDLWGSFQFNQTRTYQADQTLDGMPTHFIAINLHGAIDIIEIQGQKVAVYSGMATGNERDTVSLAFDAQHNMTLLVDGTKAATFRYIGNGVYKLVQQ